MVLPDPADKPPTTPVDDTVTALLLLLQLPPTVISLNDMVEPEHTLPIPVIGAGSELTVTGYTAALHAVVT